MFTTKFSSARQLKNSQSPLNADQSNIYSCVQPVTNVNIHPGIFLGRALWADSVSPRMNTIASRDQFKAIRIKENVMANYKFPYGYGMIG